MTRTVRTRLLSTLVALAACDCAGQQLSRLIPAAACVEINRGVMTQLQNGDVAAAEALLAGMTSPADSERLACRGVVLNNIAAALASAGRTAEAETVAGRSLAVLGKIFPPDHTSLLRPLQILAATRFEQGKRAGAREAFRKMQAIRIENPQDRALIHGIAAALLEAEGRPGEAEDELLAALRACGQAGQDETADAAAFLAALGSLYIEEQRWDEASRALHRALSIVDHAPDAVAMDRIRIVYLRGVLYGRRGEWRNSEQDLALALAIADRQPAVGMAVLRPLLESYALALRGNRRRKEARAIEARANALGHDYRGENTVHITDLVPPPKGVARR